MFLYFLLSKWWAFCCCCCCYCSKFHFWIVFLLFVKVVAVAVFLALGFAFYVFFAPFVGKKLFQYIVMGLYTPLVSPLSLSMSTFFFWVGWRTEIYSFSAVGFSFMFGCKNYFFLDSFYFLGFVIITKYILCCWSFKL